MTRVIFPSHLGKVWQCQNTSLGQRDLKVRSLWLGMRNCDYVLDALWGWIDDTYSDYLWNRLSCHFYWITHIFSSQSMSLVAVGTYDAQKHDLKE